MRPRAVATALQGVLRRVAGHNRPSHDYFCAASQQTPYSEKLLFARVLRLNFSVSLKYAATPLGLFLVGRRYTVVCGAQTRLSGAVCVCYRGENVSFFSLCRVTIGEHSCTPLEYPVQFSLGFSSSCTVDQFLVCTSGQTPRPS